jgi:outer membrane immunogenic protein
MRLVLACLAIALALAGASASAADLTRRGRIAAPPAPTYAPAPYTAPEPDYKVSNWYIGGAAGYAFADDDTWQGSVYGGWLWRPNATLGLGVEADYTFRDLGHFALDDGIASLRGRAGVFVAPGTFVYGTAGVAQSTDAVVPAAFAKGLVMGGGIEKDIASNVAIRAEVLHYRHTDEYFGWGDDGDSSTAARLGLALKF